MYHYYYVNNNQTLNPGLHHEVHTKEHAEQLGIRSAQYVGYFESEVEAVAHAKKIYLDGCPLHVKIYRVINQNLTAGSPLRFASIFLDHHSKSIPHKTADRCR